MATQSSILAWRISWTVDPGGIQCVGSQKYWTQLSDSTTILFKILINRKYSTSVFILFFLNEWGSTDHTQAVFSQCSVVKLMAITLSRKCSQSNFKEFKLLSHQKYYISRVLHSKQVSFCIAETLGRVLSFPWSNSSGHFSSICPSPENLPFAIDISEIEHINSGVLNVTKSSIV